MIKANRFISQKWRVFGQIVLALAVGTTLFVFLNIASGGLFLAMAITAGCFAVLGLANYLLWGWEMSWPAVRGPRIAERETRSEIVEAPQDEFVFELNDSERMELEQMLEQSIAQSGLDERRSTLRRSLLSKFRMYGA